jgi:hypothetical protein
MNYEVEKAKQELFELLESNPELRDYQKNLTEAMDKVPENKRLMVLSTFLQYNLGDLQFELIQLKEKIQNERR